MCKLYTNRYERTGRKEDVRKDGKNKTDKDMREKE